MDNLEAFKLSLQMESRVNFKILLIIASFDEPIQVKDIRGRAYELGWKIKKSTNISQALHRSEKFVIRVPTGWELTEAGKNYVRDKGLIETTSPPTTKILSDLRCHLDKIVNDTTRAFIEEAIKCCEYALFRAAIVMSWIAAIDVLQNVVMTSHLEAFNAAAGRGETKWRDVINKDDLGRVGESRFLNFCASIGVIGKNQKDELIKCLQLRNGCSHPNSLKVGVNNTASHLETLILNVFEQFDS